MHCRPMTLRSPITRKLRTEHGRGGGVSQPRRFCEVDPKPVAPALVFARHLRTGMAELLLHVALVDLGR